MEKQPLQIIDAIQGSEEWRLSRLGIVTASKFKDVLSKGQGKTRRTYLLKLVGERLTGELSESFGNEHTERGHEMEITARRLYTLQTDNSVELCGFMKRGDVGYSPDGIIGNDGLIEIKSKLPHLQLECILSGDLPSEHEAQVQGGLWVTGREWCDFLSFWPGLPLFKVRAYRNESYISNLTREVDAFVAEIYETIELIKQKAA